MGDIQGRVEEIVARALEAGTEDGVQVAVYRGGELLVDVAAGVADRRTGRPMTADTPCYAASAMKAVTATVVHVLAERGVLDYGTRVAEVWPEFGAHGKEEVTLRHVLTHSAGVPAVPADTTAESLCDWDRTCAAIAGLPPWWAPGERVAYHAATFGYILGEVVRRTTGKPISRVLAEEVTEPLGVAGQVYFAVPEDQLDRVAVQEDDPAAREVFDGFPDDFPLFKAAPRAVMPSPALANRRESMLSEQPFHGYATANGMARTFAALLGPVDGVRLVSPERLAAATALATAGLVDEMTMGEARWGLGYAVFDDGADPDPGVDSGPDSGPDSGSDSGSDSKPDPSDRVPTLFGMVGMGGAAVFANRRTGVSFAVAKNRFNPIRTEIVDRVGALVAETFS